MLKKTIENRLHPLIGLELTRTTRIINMECLKFGYRDEKLKNGKIVNVGKYGLHLQCEWRVIHENKMIIGSRDLYEPIIESDWDESFDYEKGNLRDKKIRGLIKETKLVVQKIEADEVGGLTIVFSNNFSLQIIPLNTSNIEYWRLLNNVDETESHFVVERVK